MDWETQLSMIILGGSKRYQPGPHGLKTEDDNGLQVEAGGDNKHIVTEDDPD